MLKPVLRTQRRVIPRWNELPITRDTAVRKNRPSGRFNDGRRFRRWGLGPARAFSVNDPIAESRPLAPLSDFQRQLAGLYPELCGAVPDLERYAESVIVRALNLGAPDFTEAVLEFYGIERVRSVAQAQVNRLDRPAYRKWKEKLQLPERTEIVERFHRMWRA